MANTCANREMTPSTADLKIHNFGMRVQLVNRNSKSVFSKGFFKSKQSSLYGSLNDDDDGDTIEDLIKEFNEMEQKYKTLKNDKLYSKK